MIVSTGAREQTGEEKLSLARALASMMLAEFRHSIRLVEEKEL
jgi:hypothetical protein